MKWNIYPFPQIEVDIESGLFHGLNIAIPGWKNALRVGEFPLGGKLIAYSTQAAFSAPALAVRVPFQFRRWG